MVQVVLVVQVIQMVHLIQVVLGVQQPVPLVLDAGTERH